ncbi:MAG: hypothetical protein PWP34_103 [Desulfuromonadales bacterium]|jgi:hypothetical protein|nr:hypothetical protein [Desulfuromonadales bacterium]
MKDRNVNSYNLLYAQQLLSNLAPGRAGFFHKSANETKTFTRLNRQKAHNSVSPEPAAPPPEADSNGLKSLHQPTQTFSDWESCIDWCMKETRAESAFVVDSQGFIIAMRGRIPGHGFECTGAELIYAMDQLERIDPDAGKLLWIDLDFNKRRLVGFVTPMENKEYFIVGLVAPEPSYNASKHVISKHVIESLPHMN